MLYQTDLCEVFNWSKLDEHALGLMDLCIPFSAWAGFQASLRACQWAKHMLTNNLSYVTLNYIDIGLAGQLGL